MLTRFIRIQLIVFTIASIVGVAVMVFTYMQVPTLLGLGRITVKMELPAGGGLYRFSNVTYRGVQVGTVTSVDLTENGAEATLSLNTSSKIPSDLQAAVRSVSAVGEQYVDLLPRTDSPPYLQNGSVIAMADTTIPQEVGPMLDQVSALVDSIPANRLSDLLDESFTALNGAGYDFGSLLDSGSTITRDVNEISDRARALIDDAGPFLDAQAQTTDSIRTWAASLAGITGQLADDDPEVRSILANFPGFASETSQLLEDVKPTLPVLLANLTTVGQIAVTYNPSIEQLLVLLPAYIAETQTVNTINNPSGQPLGEFSLSLGDPPVCTVGFLPPSAWRSPADLTIVDTPDDIYCKLPQDAPLAVRGARNYPCMGHPGKRAPTVELCNDPNGFQPLAQRQHALGPYPIDPNLISQGVPVHDWVNPDAQIFGPPGGTPLPPGVTAPPPGAPVVPPVGPPSPPLPVGPLPPGPMLLDAPPPAAPGAPAPVPFEVPPPAPDPAAPADPGMAADPHGLPPVAAPSAFGGAESDGPSVTIAKYNPRTGEYMGSDGKLYQQADLAASAKSWKDLMPT